MNVDKPVFPLTITWHEDGEQESFRNEIDAAVTLEWFDSGAADAEASVIDAKGRPVTLVVEKLEVKLCRLA